MLHTLFFLMSFVTDYREVVEAIQNYSRLGLVNAGILSVIGVGVCLRNWFANRHMDGRQRTGA